MTLIHNPILRGFNPDPSILRVGQDYYIATSTFEWFPGVRLYHSTDLVNWDLIGYPLDSTEKINMLELSARTGISRTTLNEIEKRNSAREDVCEKIYSYIYKNKYRINSVKEELIKEKYGTVLFHGSRDGLSTVTTTGSRNNCDFGNGFYLGETYNQALSFVSEKDGASVYSFR